MNNVTVLESVKSHDREGEWNLLFQWVRYNYDDGSPHHLGYRFIWQRDNGKLQAARGQARIPTAENLLLLVHRATEAGWFVSVEQERDDEFASQTASV